MEWNVSSANNLFPRISSANILLLGFSLHLLANYDQPGTKEIDPERAPRCNNQISIGDQRTGQVRVASSVLEPMNSAPKNKVEKKNRKGAIFFCKTDLKSPKKGSKKTRRIIFEQRR